MQRQMIRFRPGFATDGQVEAQLQNWAEQLHDLTGRNRLLFYRDTRASSAIILDPPFLQLFHDLVEKGRELRVPVPSLAEITRQVNAETNGDRVEDLAEVLAEVNGDAVEGNTSGADQGALPGASSSVQPEESGRAASRPLPRRRGASQAAGSRKHLEILANHSVPHLNDIMYNLRYAARTVQEEQGFNILYITFGMLRWRDIRSTSFSQAPLVLVPIRLDRQHPGSPYTIRMAEDDLVLNPVLQIKLSRDFGIQLPDIGNDLAGSDLNALFAEVAETISELEGWGIEEKATLGAFNFLTQLLIKDFEVHGKLYARHPLVRWLSGIEPGQPGTGQSIPEASQLDETVDPSSVFQVLDADSSQQEAIEAAKRGLSFVLEGPPGTGKSQTIANLIAESIMAGKRVLFVSQKMAALEVVQNRLRQKGLAEFCLEVHSHRMDKRKVIHDLMRTLSDSAMHVGNPEHGMKQQEIRQIRDELNAYVRQLHEPGLQLGLSPYEMYGRLARYLDEAPLEFPIEAIETWSSSDLAERLALIRELAGYEALITGYFEGRWRGWDGLRSSLADRERIAASLASTSQAILSLHEGVSAVAGRYGLSVPATIGEDLQFMQVLSCFNSEVFSPGLQGAIGRYKVQSLPGGQAFSLQYGEDSRKLAALYRDRGRFTAQQISEALTALSKINGRGRQAPTTAPVEAPEEAEHYNTLLKAMLQMDAGLLEARSLFREGEAPGALQAFKEQSPREVAEWFSDYASHTGELADWAEFNAARRVAEEKGLGPFVSRALEAGIPPERWEGAFCRRFYRLCIEQVMKDRPLLQRFRGSTHSQLVRRFRALDLATIDLSSSRIRAELSKRRPHWSWMRAESAETSVLRREFNKKRALKPLRRLFSEIPNLIQALKPCLMMSPLTVCQLLDPTIHQFDLAVFDEASQIPPEYAISAFLRAKQVVVAGDSQQLPPMNFFQTMEGDERDDDQDEDHFESILTLCDSRGFPSKMLNWHYRSRDESLIAYSNFHFYDNRLHTFPSARRDNPATGLKFVYVPEGAYHAGEGARNNPVEARRVAELVVQHLTETPDLSLGIVTFSVPQRRAIERELESLRIRNRQLEGFFRYDVQEPLFVKNLENVQGDERDVIILSVGYGRDEAGKIALNFGPLNRDGGARRLNVAVTRARRLLYLVSSMQPEDVDLNRAASQGAGLLRSYLETARDGVAALHPATDEVAEPGPETSFEESVFGELTKRGFEVVRRVGASQYRVELAVRDPQERGRFILGLESDGQMYRSGSTARDRDRLRAQVLEGLGWKMHRIWSRDWVQDRETELKKVIQLIEGRTAPQELQRSPAASRPPFPVHGSSRREPTSTPALPEGSIPYMQPELPKPAETGMRALLEVPLSQIIDALQRLANSEGPISIPTAKTLVLRAWETRQGEKVNARLDRAVAKGAEQGAYMINGNFIWPTGRQVAPLRVHVSGQPTRKIGEIAPEEIERAVGECVRSAVTIGRDDLIRETGRLFGLKSSEENTAAIGRVVDAMLRRRTLFETAGKLRLGK